MEAHKNLNYLNQNPRVLVVDDEETICYALKKFLSAAGFQVSLAYDASEAQAIIHDRMFYVDSQYHLI
jgi:DNA-binding response OmpR family regulator